MVRQQDVLIVEDDARRAVCHGIADEVVAVSHLGRITGWGDECDEEFARLRHAGVVGYTGERAGGAGTLPLQAVAQRIAYVVDCEHVEHVVLPAGRPVANSDFHAHDEGGIPDRLQAHARGDGRVDGRVERITGWDGVERRTGLATDRIRAGAYRWHLENHIRAGNTTLPRLEA